MVKIGLCGVGYLGKIHLNCLQQTDFELVGFYDIDPDVRSLVVSQYDLKAFDDLDSMLELVDAIDIVTPTNSHFEIAKKAISRSKHCFIEKPVTESLAEAIQLQQLQNTYPVKIQVGHVERYNPAVLAVQSSMNNPMFVEGHRLSPFLGRGAEVSVIMDLMIHDIDLILDWIDAPVKEVQANAVCVINDTPDICNARIAFENGAVANLTASRMSMKKMRKLRCFQSNAYVSVDLLNKEAQLIQFVDENANIDTGMTIETMNGKKAIDIKNIEVKDHNAILMELNDFYQSVYYDKPCKVNLDSSIKSMELAEKISNIAINNLKPI